LPVQTALQLSEQQSFSSCVCTHHTSCEGEGTPFFGLFFSYSRSITQMTNNSAQRGIRLHITTLLCLDCSCKYYSKLRSQMIPFCGIIWGWRRAGGEGPTGETSGKQVAPQPSLSTNSTSKNAMGCKRG
jgi:hypothetical protein